MFSRCSETSTSIWCSERENMLVHFLPFSTALQDLYILEWFSVEGCVGSQLLEGISLW